MAADDNETDQEPRASRPSDPGAEAANRADDRSTFIGLGTADSLLSVPPAKERDGAASAGSNQDAPSSVPSESGAAPSIESKAESSPVEVEAPASERPKSRPPVPEPALAALKLASKNEPQAVAEAEPTSDRAGASKAVPKELETEESASTDGPATQPRRQAASAAQASREPEGARPGSGGALLTVLALAGVALVGGWWMLNRDSDPGEKSDSPTMQQDPVPAKLEETAPTETRAEERAAEVPAQPLPPAGQPSDDRAAETSTEPGAGVPSGAPAGDAPEDDGAEKAATSAQRKLRTAALVAISKDATKMRNCRRKPDPVGTAQARVTFDSSGRVSRVRVLSPYAATHTGACLTERLKQITIDPFPGKRITVQAAIQLY